MCGTHVSELVTIVTETFPVGQTLSQAEQGCDLGQCSPPLCSSITTSVNENTSFTGWLGNLMEKKNQSYSWNFGYQNLPVSIRLFFFFILTTTLSEQYNDPTLWFRTLRTGTSGAMSKVTHLRRWIWDSKPGLSRTQVYVSN